MPESIFPFLVFEFDTSSANILATLYTIDLVTQEEVSEKVGGGGGNDPCRNGAKLWIAVERPVSIINLIEGLCSF